MAALMFQVPSETARILHELEVPGNPEKHDPHITVLYLGKDVPIETISEMLPVIYQVTSRTAPFSVSTNHVGYFPPGDDGMPIIAKIQSPPLHDFRKVLTSAFDDHGIEYDKKFPDYKPHTTLAYAPDREEPFELDIPEISWGCHELVLWGSNRGTGRLTINFPFSLGKVASQDVFKRAAIKLASWGQKDQFV